MAFQEYKPRLYCYIREADEISFPNHTQHATGGLNVLFNRIRNRQTSVRHEPGQFTDQRGRFVVVEGLPLLNSRYRVLSLLGEGTFCSMVHAEDTFCSRKRYVAIKVMHAKYNYVGVQECTLIGRIQNKDHLYQANIVRFYSAFYFDHHLCIVLEWLGMPLLNYMQYYPHWRVPTDRVRKIAIQLVSTFAFLEKHDYIHADLKPENVLQVRTKNSSVHKGVRVKLIDFGNTMRREDAARSNFNVQTMYYRAPEVLLGAEFSCPIDMWSLGCLIVELCTGRPLFHCRNNSELLSAMLNLLGPIPEELFKQGKLAAEYDLKDRDILPKNDHKKARDVQNRRLACIGKTIQTHERDLVTFVGGLLEYDPKKRLTPKQALRHPFFHRLFPFSLFMDDEVENAVKEEIPVLDSDCLGGKGLLTGPSKLRASPSNIFTKQEHPLNDKRIALPMTLLPTTLSTASRSEPLISSSSSSASSSSNSAPLSSPNWNCDQHRPRPTPTDPAVKIKVPNLSDSLHVDARNRPHFPDSMSNPLSRHPNDSLERQKSEHLNPGQTVFAHPTVQTPDREPQVTTSKPTPPAGLLPECNTEPEPAITDVSASSPGGQTQQDESLNDDSTDTEDENRTRTAPKTSTKGSANSISPSALKSGQQTLTKPAPAVGNRGKGAKRGRKSTLNPTENDSSNLSMSPKQSTHNNHSARQRSSSSSNITLIEDFIGDGSSSESSEYTEPAPTAKRGRKPSQNKRLKTSNKEQHNTQEQVSAPRRQPAQKGKKKEVVANMHAKELNSPKKAGPQRPASSKKKKVIHDSDDEQEGACESDDNYEENNSEGVSSSPRAKQSFGSSCLGSMLSPSTAVPAAKPPEAGYESCESTSRNQRLKSQHYIPTIHA